MKFTLAAFAALFSIIAATLTPGAGGLPGPPAGKFSHVKQQCQAHQANIRCCNLAGGNNGGNNKYDVQVGDKSIVGICDQDITSRLLLNYIPEYEAVRLMHPLRRRRRQQTDASHLLCYCRLLHR